MFVTKDSLFIFAMIISILWQYILLQFNLGKQTYGTNTMEILPIYVFLISYLIYTILHTYKIIRKNSHMKTTMKPTLNSSNVIEKYLQIIMDHFLIASLLIFIFCVSIYYRNLSLQQKYRDSNNGKYGQELQKLCLVGVILFIIGNLYKLGNVICSLFFYGIEKEYFPAKNLKFCVNVKLNIQKDLTLKSSYTFQGEANEPLLHNSAG
jgi:hypothetical protein